MKIKNITIERFKKVEKVDFDLGDVNILVGGNNSGKSTIIQGIHFAFTLFQSMNISNKWPARTKKSTTLTVQELIYVPSDNPYALGYGGRLLEDDDKSIILGFQFDNGEVVSIKVKKGRVTNIVAEPENIDFCRNISTLSSPYSVFSPGLAGVSRTETYVSDGVLLRALARGDANIVLRNILYRLRGKEEWAAFESDLSEIFPGLTIEISFDPAIDQYIDINISDGITIIPIDLAGTGLLQAIQILTYLHLFSPKLIILDEPDSHLHPNNQRLLCSLLSSIALDRGVQVLITTHSRHVIDAMYGESNILWVQENNVKPVGPEDQIDILLELGALDVKEKISSHAYKVVFLTEDKINNLLAKLLWSSGFVEAETAILPYNGVTSLHLLEPLIRSIQSHTKAAIFVHRDRDYLQEDEVEAWKKGVRAMGAIPFVTREIDIEGYFCTDDALKEFVAANAGGDLTGFKALIADGETDGIIINYVNGRIDLERKSGNIAKVDIGKLSAAAAKDVNADPTRFMKGKKKLSKVRKIAAEHYGAPFELPAVTDPELVNASKKYFPAA